MAKNGRRIIGITIAVASIVAGGVLLLLGKLGTETLVSQSTSGNFISEEVSVTTRPEIIVPLYVALAAGLLLAFWPSRRGKS